MSQEVIQNNSARFTTRYRAICTRNDYTGPWRATRSQAIQDALRHQGEQPHRMVIEVEQTQRIQAEISDEELNM